MNKIVRDFEGIVLTRLLESPLSHRVQIILGPRHVGKTTGMKHIASSWKGPVVFASADLPIAQHYEWIQQQWHKARAYDSQDTLLVLDEVQKIDGWSAMVKVLIDEERQRGSRLRVVLLGSASWLIQEGLTETLAGRFELIKAYHWTYSECREAFGWDLDTYLQFGGYPGAADLISDPDRWQQFILDAMVEPLLSKDILPLKHVAKPALFKQAFALAMAYPAQEIALHKLLGKLQDHGNSATLRSYLQMMESGFVLQVIEKYSTRPLCRKSSAPKLLPLCPALVHAFTDPRRVLTDTEWKGRVFEAVIGAHLCRVFTKVFYWRDGNEEVDFVVEHDRQVIAIEVKSGRKKSSRGLTSFNKQFPNSKTLVIDPQTAEALLLRTDPRLAILDLCCL